MKEPKQKVDKIRKLITITPRTEQMAGEIMIEEGYGSFSQMVSTSIAQHHGEMVKKQMYRGKSASKTSSGERRQEDQDREDREKTLICDQLGGEVVEVDGGKVCRYFTYVGRKRYEQEMSLSLINRDLLGTQYTPNKTSVEQLQKEGKCDY